MLKQIAATSITFQFLIALYSVLTFSLDVNMENVTYTFGQRVVTWGSVVQNPPANAGDKGLIPGLGISLEKEMATHSNILAWRIPSTEEPGRLHSMESQKVGHD